MYYCVVFRKGSLRDLVLNEGAGRGVRYGCGVYNNVNNNAFSFLENMDFHYPTARGFPALKGGR